MNRIVLNETSYFGKDSRKEIVNEIKKRNFKHALLVSDDVLKEIGLLSKVTTILDEASISYTLFTNVKPNPSIENVNEGLEICKNVNADYIIAVGGGSVIDTAKCIGIVMTNPEHADIVSLEGAVNTKNKSLPIIALPTTAGTAAEVTINYVITDKNREIKMVCVDPNDIPVLSIIDSELMKDMPKSVAASTGMDALTHAIEGYITKASWTMTDMFHLEAMKLIYENLEKSIEKDEIAIENMGLAQYIAGMGFSNVGLGIVHSMAHQLGAVYDTPHGVANALLLPYVLEFNGASCKDKFKKMAQVFNLNIENKTEDEIVLTVVEAIRNLGKRLGIPQTLKEINVKEEDLDMLSEKAIKDPCTPGNPIDVTKEDIYSIYKKAF